MRSSTTTPKDGQDKRSPSGTPVSDDTLRQLHDIAGVSVWSWHPAENRVFHSSGGGALDQGVTIEATLQHIHPDDRRRIKRRLVQAVRTGQSGSFRFRNIATGSDVRTLSATYFLAGHGEIEIIVQDVTRTALAEQALRESEDHYRTAVALNPEILWLADPEGNIIEFGPRWSELVGFDAAETLGEGWAQALHPDDFGPTLAKWHHALRTGEPVDVEYRVKLKSGDYTWMRARASARRDADGSILRWYGTLEDIHQSKLAVAALRDSEEFSRSILESSTMAIEVLEADGRLVFMNGPGIEVMEVDDFERIRNRPYESFWPDDAKPAIREAIEQARQGLTVRRTLFGPTAKGAPRWWDLTISPIRKADGRITQLLALSNDVTDAKRNELEIAHLARHDALTGLPNRMHFRERIEAALALRHGEQPMAVLCVDLDDFKLVNDTLGHPAGDALLRDVAVRLGVCAGRHGFVARLGGDEFALLLEVKRLEDPATAAQSILGAVGQPYIIDGETVSIGASIGIAMAPRDGTNAEMLLQNADVALYRVKAEHGHGFRFFEPAMDLALKERREMKRELSLALHHDELSVVFQPQIDIASNRLTGFEALLRWANPLRGPVSPAIFIPLAEESGLIDEIGAFVLDVACAEAMHWPDSITLAVNLSPAQFRSRAVNRTVAAALSKTGLAPGRLELEITESVLLDESAGAIAALKELHATGVRVALDDFGTGYSSLSYLRRFPFDKIKIDRSFVADLPDAEGSAAIVRAIIGLGRSLKTRVTAEGVETWEQLLLLSAEGCDEAQGYLFSQPLPATQARALAQTQSAAIGLRRRSHG